MWFAVKLTVSLALLAWLFAKFSDVTSLAPKAYLPLVVGLAAASLHSVLAAVRWHVIVRLYSRSLRFPESARIQYVSFFMNQFLPGLIAGDAVRVYFLHKKAVRLDRAIASAMLDRAAAMLALVVILGAATTRIIDVVREGHARLILFALAAALCAGTLALVLLSPVLQRWAQRFPWVSPFALLASGIRDLSRNARTLAAVVAISVTMHVLYAFVLWTSLRAFEQETAFLTVLTVFAPIILLQMLPISIAGWGVRELMGVTMLTAVGVAAPHALAASFFVGVLYAIASLPGSVFWLGGGMHRGQMETR